MSETQLHPQLEKDCIVLSKLRLSYLLMVNDSNFPWFLLVPDRKNITEMHQLRESDQQVLMMESVELSRTLQRAFIGDKMNVAALGNEVPQLHVHHIVRYKDDVAWPKPVWGFLPAKPYSDVERKIAIEKLKKHAPYQWVWKE